MIKNISILMTPLVATLLSTTALAQSQSQQTTTGNTPATAIQEVVVTARRREEVLEKVPLPVTAVTASQLAAANIDSTRQLQMITPGLVMTKQLTSLTPYMRGVGGQTAGVGIEPNVSTYVDGVYIAPSWIGSDDFNGVDHIEVLRGPQGTLFGRNSTGGLLQIITLSPTQQPDLRLGVSYGNYDTTIGNFYVSSPLTDKIAANLAINFINQGQGFGENLTLHIPVNYEKNLSIRSKVVAQPNDRLKLTVSGDWEYMNSDIGLERNILPGTVGEGGITYKGTPWDTQANIPPKSFLTQGGGSLRIDYDFGAFTLSNLAAARRYLEVQTVDDDFSPVGLVDALFNHSGETTLQEELLANGKYGRLDWTVGFFYFGDVADQNLDVFGSPVASLNANSHGNLNKNSFAEFGQLTYEIIRDTHITLGARYTTDEQRFNGVDVAAPGNAKPVGTVVSSTGGILRNTESQPTWRIGIDHQLNKDMMIYTFYTRGFKDGGYSPSSLTEPVLKPETLDDVEAGFKSEMFNHRLRLNVDGYYYYYKNLQLIAYVVGITQTTNAAPATLYGGEAEITALPPVPVGTLQFNGSLSLEHATYGNFPNAQWEVSSPAACLPYPPHQTGPATGPATSCLASATGKNLVRVPAFTAGLAIDYALPVSGGKVDFNTDIYYTSKFYWDPANLYSQPGYALVNAQVAFLDDNHWTFKIFARNLFNQIYYSYVTPGSVGTTTEAGDPRTFGVGVDYRWR